MLKTPYPATSLRLRGANHHRATAEEAASCEDDSDWFAFINNKVKTCEHVARGDTNYKCNNWDGYRSLGLANEGCPVTCGTCPTNAPTNASTNSPTGAPTMSPTETPNCITLVGGSWTETERDDFCATNDCCNGNDYSCSGWNLNAPYTICEGSCKGGSACKSLAQDSNSTLELAPTIFVGKNACSGARACYDYSERKPDLAKLEIGHNSCSGYQACTNLGRTEGTEIIIGESSCQGEGACYGIGTTQAVNINIGDKSCMDYYSCGFIGGETSITIDIEGNNCNGYESCMDVGFHA